MTQQPQPSGTTADRRDPGSRLGVLRRALAPYLVQPSERDAARAVASYPATRSASVTVLPRQRDHRAV